ncbi:Gfo/Idh/MocA family oxidoreductase [Aquabacter sp. CN5-332]|uniref:Gfo/Idh/MocA family protein n=1 Tax=Aquabacter sp. CN5-332 TaxID=3156608 RepID=UPI0032B3A437
MPSQLPLKVASIGLGWWSDELAKSVEGSDKIKIVACVSRSKAKRDAFAARFGARPIETYEQALADPEIDGVILTTPHSMHGDHVRMAAAAGKHVFVEKPFTLQPSDGADATEACRKAGVVLAVGHNRRFSSGGAWLKEQIDSGALGTILHAEANISAPGALGYTEDRWRANRTESPGGAISGLGIHMIDLLTWLLGPVTRLNANAIRRAVPVDMDDTTSALFQFSSGATGYLGTIFVSPFQSFLTVYGTKGIAQIAPEANTGWLRPAGAPGGWTKAPGGPEEVKTFDPIDTLTAELEEFADTCAGRGSYRVLPEEAIHNVAIMQGIVESAAHEGKAVVPR